MDGGADVGAVEVGSVGVVRVEAGTTMLVDVVGLEVAASREVVVVRCVEGVAGAPALIAGVVDDVGEALGGVGAAVVEIANSGVVAGGRRWWSVAFEVHAGGVAGDDDGALGGICDLGADGGEAAVLVSLFQHFIHVLRTVAVSSVGVPEGGIGAYILVP